MAIPAEFNFSSEDDFIQRFLIPLLNRLGYSVVNYHGPQEFGRDLIFAEIDRFGHVRYHALQAKYVASIGKSDSHGLVEDCLESFANPFKHPQTGASERISSFYAVNGGDISEPATTHYFNSLIQFGSNARLLDGKALIALDRWASFNRSEAIGETLNGLIIEMRLNRKYMNEVLDLWSNWMIDEKKPLPLRRLRDAAVANYMARPIAQGTIDIEIILKYVHYIDISRSIMDFCLMSLAARENKKELINNLINESTNFYLWGNEIEKQAASVLAMLGPLIGL